MECLLENTYGGWVRIGNRGGWKEEGGGQFTGTGAVSRVWGDTEAHGGRRKGSTHSSLREGASLSSLCAVK